MTTTNGTRAILASLDAERVLVGAFANFAATVAAAPRTTSQADPHRLRRHRRADQLRGHAPGRGLRPALQGPGRHPMGNDEAEIVGRALGQGRGRDLVQAAAERAGRGAQPPGPLPEPGPGRPARARARARRPTSTTPPSSTGPITRSSPSSAATPCGSWPFLTRRHSNVAGLRGEPSRPAAATCGRSEFVGRKAGSTMDGHGQAGLALQAPGVHLPVERDLRRDQRLLGLRPARRRAEAEHQGRLVARQRPAARRHGRARLLDHHEPEGLGGVGPRRRVQRPDGRLPGDQGALSGRPALRLRLRLPGREPQGRADRGLALRPGQLARGGRRAAREEGRQAGQEVRQADGRLRRSSPTCSSTRPTARRSIGPSDRRPRHADRARGRST